MYTHILDYKVFNKGIEDLLVEISSRDKVNIISGNPEVLFNGISNEFLHKSFLDDHTILIPDGIGTVLASKIVKEPVKERIPGIEVMKKVIEMAISENKSVYFLGAKEEVVNATVDNLKKQYPSLKVAGKHNGFFDINNCDDLVKEIKESNPWAIFVATGSPKQEQFIEDHFSELPCKIFMGVGGSFDIYSGNLKRAPKWMQKIGLEWLYRVANEPKRIKRLGVIPKFLWKVFRDK